jgi:protein-tyrosine phosphatase
VLDGTPNKVTLPLLSGDIYTVTANYQKYITDGYNKEFKDCFAPTPLTISWESKEEPWYYTFDISTSKDMLHAESYVTFDTSVTLKNLFMGYDYYYQITAKYENKLIKSRIFEFSTEYLPRTVLVDAQVSNTRDWGGYYTQDGKRMKQGIVYRGGALESITEAGKQVMLNELKIRTDLDVRGDSGSPLLSSPLGDSVNYIETKGPYYINPYGQGIDQAGEYQEALAKEIRTFANPDNFPVYVHCSLGRDRTGTLCFLMQALLGVGETDIYRDYELSFMARTGKQPSDRAQIAQYMVGLPFAQLYNYIKKLDKSKTMQENAETFMLSIGITANEIAAIKANMLEEVK